MKRRADDSDRHALCSLQQQLLYAAPLKVLCSFLRLGLAGHEDVYRKATTTESSAEGSKDTAPLSLSLSIIKTTRLKEDAIFEGMIQQDPSPDYLYVPEGGALFWKELHNNNNNKKRDFDTCTFKGCYPIFRLLIEPFLPFNHACQPEGSSPPLFFIHLTVYRSLIDGQKTPRGARVATPRGVPGWRLFDESQSMADLNLATVPVDTESSTISLKERDAAFRARQRSHARTTHKIVPLEAYRFDRHLTDPGEGG